MGGSTLHHYDHDGPSNSPLVDPPEQQQLKKCSFEVQNETSSKLALRKHWRNSADSMKRLSFKNHSFLRIGPQLQCQRPPWNLPFCQRGRFFPLRSKENFSSGIRCANLHRRNDFRQSSLQSSRSLAHGN